jgi:5-methylcytosine-specific restriction endonuclease McrA
MDRVECSLADILAELVAGIIGWAFCMAMLAGGFAGGLVAARFFGGAEHSEAFGILSAISIVWIYEHRVSQERWDKLREMIARRDEP